MPNATDTVQLQAQQSRVNQRISTLAEAVYSRFGVTAQTSGSHRTKLSGKSGEDVMAIAWDQIAISVITTSK